MKYKRSSARKQTQKPHRRKGNPQAGGRAQNRTPEKMPRARAEWAPTPSGIYEGAVAMFGLRSEFPEGAILEAEERSRSRITKTLLQKREDLRDMTIFTIDGEDAQDFDDAVSIERLEECTRLGVHIADVTAYVSARGEVNSEAAERGTSVYLSGKVLPMLPEELSNGICSLNPDVDRLTLSLFIDIDDEGNVVDYRYTKAVIRSKARLFYERLNRMFDGDVKELELMEERNLAKPLHEMAALAELLRKKRRRRGALDFDIPESFVELDTEGYPREISIRESGVSNKLIEEFMLIANEVTAAFAAKHKLPFLYRVHEAPMGEKMEAFSVFVNNYGLRLPKKITSKSLQKLLAKVKGRPDEGVISHLMLRAMQKARYDAEPIGHFGLATADYCHFTSPIRRYPDLVIHRILTKQIAGTLSQREKNRLIKIMPELAEHTSNRERAAMEAEREVESAFKALFMTDHIGESFDGTISGISSFGFFVMLENSVEGLVRLANLPVYLEYNKVSNLLSDSRGEFVFGVGDRIRIRVLDADAGLRRIDFLPEGVFTLGMYVNALDIKPGLVELMMNPVFSAMFNEAHI